LGTGVVGITKCVDDVMWCASVSNTPMGLAENRRYMNTANEISNVHEDY
jgi:hypothetical protein